MVRVLEWGGPWVRAPIGSNQTIKLVFDDFPLSMEHYEESAKTGWLGIR
jgi:hypothetical protein